MEEEGDAIPLKDSLAKSENSDSENEYRLSVYDEEETPIVNFTSSRRERETTIHAPAHFLVFLGFVEN